MSDKKKKITKEAEIRSDESDGCPFGLEISKGCRLAGMLVENMAPIGIMGEDSTGDEKSEITQANSQLFKWKCPGKRCKFASQLFEGNDSVVQCNWNTRSAGIQEGGAIMGSPYYYKHYSGIGLDGVFTYPLGYYTDNSIDRGMYHGMYSIESPGGEERDEENINKDSDNEEEGKTG
jgi:hypothetical protein